MTIFFAYWSSMSRWWNGAFFFFLLSILIWFLLITWCWIIHLKGATSVAHSPHFGFLWAKPSGWLCTTNSQSQNAPELAPQIHTVYSRTQLSMVPLWFSNLHKKTKKTTQHSTFLIMFIILVSAYSIFILLIHSALGFFFFLFPFFEIMKLADDEMHFFGKRSTGAQTYFCYCNFGGKKIYRTWLLCCKFLSSICP